MQPQTFVQALWWHGTSLVVLHYQFGLEKIYQLAQEGKAFTSVWFPVTLRKLKPGVQPRCDGLTLRGTWTHPHSPPVAFASSVESRKRQVRGLL